MRPLRARRTDLRLGRRALRAAALCAAGQPHDWRQGADRRHRRLYGDLLVGGFQRLRAAEDLPHLTSREPASAGSSRHPSGLAGAGMGMIMITIRRELGKDVAAREALLDLGYGAIRFSKVSHRLREGRLPAAGLAFVACDHGRLVGTVQLWDVATSDGRPALLLGPLTVHPSHRDRGVGGALMRHALAAAAQLGHQAVLLVGDAAYYERFGFSA